jgi:uncharacterized membrane protein
VKTEGSDERGAVAVFAAAIMVVLLIVTALVVDIGMQRVARRDMQALADTVSLDMGRLLGGGRTRQQIESGTTGFTPLATAKTRSVDRNATYVVGDRSQLAVDVYLVKLIDDVTDSDTALDNYAVSRGLPVQVATTVVPTGVVVRARTSVKFGFGAAFGTTSGSTGRSAVTSQSSPSVCFSVGAKALALDTNQSALSPLLSGILRVNLSAVGYEGLVNLKDASVPIAGLLAQLNVGSTDALASTNVSLAQFTAAAAQVAAANGDTASVAALQALRLGVPGQQINLGQILALQSGTPVAGLTSNVNILDLLTAAVVAANGQNAIAVNVPGLVDLKIIEPPRIACGTKGVFAESAQVQLRLNPTLVSGAVPGLLGGTTDLTVNVGRAKTTIDADITCLPDSVTFKTETGAVSIMPPVAPAQGQIGLRLSVGGFLNAVPAIGGLLELALRALGLSEVKLEVRVDGSVATATETRTVLYPAPPALPPTVTFPQNGIAKALDLTAAQVFITTGGVLGLITGILGAVTRQLLDNLVIPLVDTVLDPLLTTIFNSLSGVLGLRLGVADVRLMGRPVCQSVKLIA